jgi:MYXO-CTERM domain-containing protein
MGDPLPQMAARLLDVGYPASLAAGSEGEGWAIFRNEGRRSWEPGELWLEATTTWENEPSRLRDPESWPAYGVAAVLDRSVAPGEAVSMALPLKVANDEEGHVRERFHLVDQGGWVLRCPAVHFDVTVTVRRAAESAEPSDAGPPDPLEDVNSDAGCSTRGPFGGSAGWVALLAAVVAVALRRKRKS